MSDKKKITVAVSGSVGFDNEFEVPVIQSPDTDYVLLDMAYTWTSPDKPPLTNYDFAIVNSEDDIAYAIGKAVVAKNVTKLAQAGYIRQAVATLAPDSNFVDALAIYSNVSTRTGSQYTASPATVGDSFVIKQDSSSMSEGMLAVRRTTKSVRPSVLLDALEGMDEVDMLPFVNKMGWDILGYSKGFVKGSRLLICNYVENVAAEYRLIFINGRISFAHKRGRVVDVHGWTRADMSIERPQYKTCAHSITAFDQAVTKALSGEHGMGLFRVLNFLSMVLSPVFTSFDLFLTDDGKWGLFEFNSQSSSVDIGTEQYHEMTLRMLQAAHKQFEKEQAERAELGCS